MAAIKFCTYCNVKIDENNESMGDDFCQECWEEYCDREWWKATKAIASSKKNSFKTKKMKNSSNNGQDKTQ